MQLNPARERKRADLVRRTRHSRCTVYAAQPREGTETVMLSTLTIACVVDGLCSSTPRGDGNSFASAVGSTLRSIVVYAAQPREGTETNIADCGTGENIIRFMQLNPARGRKPKQTGEIMHTCNHGLCSSTPRGDGNKLEQRIDGCVFARGLCSSTPRGDGNLIHFTRSAINRSAVYAAQPREGTETTPNLDCRGTPRSRFMQLNPARGRKPPVGAADVGLVGQCGLCSSTPRGDGNHRRAISTEGMAHRFMQLNPARGRKHVSSSGYSGEVMKKRFMQLNPARGRKHI